MLPIRSLSDRIDRSQRQFVKLEDALNVFGTIDSKVCELFKQPRINQKTPEWHEARENAITASDLAAAIGRNKYQSTMQLWKKKTIGRDEFTGNAFTAHGVENEDVAAYIYEQTTGRKILDFGLLCHVELFRDKPEDISPMEWFHAVHAYENDFTWLKGSPDGITTCGRLVEIKCPVMNWNPGKIPVHYYAQVQLLLELTDLEVCDFVQYVPQQGFFYEKFDLLEIRRDRTWMSWAKNRARFTWQWIQSTRKGLLHVPVMHDKTDADEKYINPSIILHKKPEVRVKKPEYDFVEDKVEKESEQLVKPNGGLVCIDKEWLVSQLAQSAGGVVSSPNK